MSDRQLLNDFVISGSQPAFAEIVRRHAGLVYGIALRQTRDPHAADDVTQAVFIVLARKASQLCDHPTLTGWLTTTTMHAVRDWKKSTARRRKHEEQAITQAQEMRSTRHDSNSAHDQELIDQALQRLPAEDRDLLLMKYYENRSYTELAMTFGGTDEGVRKRVERSLARLRERLMRKDVVIPAALVTLFLTDEIAVAAPVATIEATLVQVSQWCTAPALPSGSLAQRVDSSISLRSHWPVALYATLTLLLLGLAWPLVGKITHRPAPPPAVRIVAPAD